MKKLFLVLMVVGAFVLSSCSDSVNKESAGVAVGLIEGVTGQVLNSASISEETEVPGVCANDDGKAMVDVNDDETEVGISIENCKIYNYDDNTETYTLNECATSADTSDLNVYVYLDMHGTYVFSEDGNDNFNGDFTLTMENASNTDKKYDISCNFDITVDSTTDEPTSDSSICDYTYEELNNITEDTASDVYQEFYDSVCATLFE